MVYISDPTYTLGSENIRQGETPVGPREHRPGSADNRQVPERHGAGDRNTKGEIRRVSSFFIRTVATGSKIISRSLNLRPPCRPCMVVRL